MFGDFTDVPDLRTVYERLDIAKAAFFAFPARIRSKFDNDALRFIEWFDDPKNDDEKRQLGLLPPKVEVGKDVKATSSDVVEDKKS